MTTDWIFDRNTVDLTGSMTLVVARRRGAALDGWKVEFAKDATTELRQALGRTVERLAVLTPRTYEPSLVIAEGEYLAVPDHLVEHAAPPLPGRSQLQDKPSPVETDPEVRALLNRASGLDLMPAPKLRDHAYLFYAIVVGSSPDNRTAFVRKKSPISSLTGGRLVFAHGGRLTKVADSLLEIDEHFHMVVTPNGIAVLNQVAFDALFRDAETLVARYPIWAKAFASLELDQSQLDVLVEGCRRNARLATRLRQIHESGHLAGGTVSLADVLAEADRLGIDKASITTDGKLDFGSAEITTLLKLLNDDLFIGGLSKVSYEAGSKSRQRRSQS